MLRQNILQIPYSVAYVWVSVHVIGAITYAYILIRVIRVYYCYIRVCCWNIRVYINTRMFYQYTRIYTMYAYIIEICQQNTNAYILPIHAYIAIIYAYAIAPMTWTATHTYVVSKHNSGRMSIRSATNFDPQQWFISYVIQFIIFITIITLYHNPTHHHRGRSRPNRHSSCTPMSTCVYKVNAFPLFESQINFKYVQV